MSGTRHGAAWLVSLALVACRPEPEVPDAQDPLQVLVDRVLAPSGVDPASAVVHEVGWIDVGTPLAEAIGAEVDVPEPGTLFLVDATPTARWSHPVTWAWVEDDGGVRAETREWYPTVDGEGFFPPYHPSVWGAPWSVEDPAEAGQDLALWDSNVGARAPGAPLAPADPCRPAPVRKALTVSGMVRDATLSDELNWRLALSGRGYEVHSLAPAVPPTLTTTPSTPTDTGGLEPDPAPVTADMVRDALASYQGDEHLDELVFTYAGHGLTGSLLLGDTTLYGQVTVDDLVTALAPIDTDRLVLVLDACHSGSLATTLPALLKDAGMVDTEIVVHAAVPQGVLAYDIRTLGGMFSRALGAAVGDAPADAPIPWSTLALGTYHEVAPGADPALAPPPQRHVPGLQERCRPAILTSAHPETGECLAGWIDAQAYDRRTYLDGIGLGEDSGTLELQNEDGAWVAVPWVWWDDDAVLTALPMRSLGFPANGHAPDLDPDLYLGLDGTYLVRATRTGGLTSPPQPVRIVYQVYEQTWAPVVSGSDFPDWVELWHPYTDGGTVQLSQTWNHARESSPIPAILRTLDADDSEPHHTTAGAIGVGRWIYDLEPGVRDLGLSYDDSQPETTYWGFRAAFPDDDVTPDPWAFTLVYD